MTHDTVYEVELKFPVTDPADVERRLTDLGGTWSTAVDQVDRYFAHPSRDFAVTDEALRLRQVGDDVVVTWKGPRIDAATKTRREIELPVAPATEARSDGAATIAVWTDLLEALGFRQVRQVTKRRRTAILQRDGGEIEAVLDDVAGLGWFLELEERATAADVDRARERLGALACDIGCGTPERRSYLELLLAANRP